MKTYYSILLVFLILARSWGADSISIEEFKKITDGPTRWKIIQQAPLEQKEELKKAELHLQLVSDFGGEAGLKTARETQVVRARGLWALETIFITQNDLWNQYYGTVLQKNTDNTGKISVSGESEVLALMDKIESLRRDRQPQIHSFVFNIAPSPQALKLEKRVETLNANWTAKYLDGTKPDQPPITKQQLNEVNKQVEQIFEEIKQLPKLTPEQAQKDFDAFTEDKVRPW